MYELYDKNNGSSVVLMTYDLGNQGLMVFSTYCLTAKQAALKRKIKDWLARNQDNVSERSDMSTHGLLFQ